MGKKNSYCYGSERTQALPDRPTQLCSVSHKRRVRATGAQRLLDCVCSSIGLMRVQMVTKTDAPVLSKRNVSSFCQNGTVNFEWAKNFFHCKGIPPLYRALSR